MTPIYKTISYRILMLLTSWLIIRLNIRTKSKVILLNCVNMGVYYLHEIIVEKVLA